MVWVIGKNGMLGRELCRVLDAKGFSWVGTGHEIDASDITQLEKFFSETETKNYLSSHNERSATDSGKITWIINCAAYSDVNTAEVDPLDATSANVTAAQNIARVARNHSAKLIHFSSDYVFDGTKNLPYVETDARNPLNTYGKTKSEGEDCIIRTMTQYYIIRLSWLYGSGKQNFVTKIASMLQKNDEFSVVSDEIGTPTYAANAAEIAVKFIEKTNKASGLFGKNSIPSYGIYHYTDGGEVSRFEFAQEIQRLLKKHGLITKECKILPCKTAEIENSVKRPLNTVLSKEKIIKELKIKLPDWKQSLELFIKQNGTPLKP